MTESMNPVLRVNETISVDEYRQFSELAIGDIISLKPASPYENNKTIVSRISAIIEPGNNLTGDGILCTPIVIKGVISE